VEHDTAEVTRTDGAKVHGMETGRFPNFDLNMELTIHSQSLGEVNGRVISISESGISAALQLDLPIGETIKLALHLPMGILKVKAVVKSKHASQYRFEFVDLDVPLHLIQDSSDAVGCFRLLLVLAYVAGCNWRSSANLPS
jgi:hypothetical protein